MGRQPRIRNWPLFAQRLFYCLIVLLLMIFARTRARILDFSSSGSGDREGVPEVAAPDTFLNSVAICMAEARCASIIDIFCTICASVILHVV